jgi:hypothetical protein
VRENAKRRENNHQILLEFGGAKGRKEESKLVNRWLPQRLHPLAMLAT